MRRLFGGAFLVMARSAADDISPVDLGEMPPVYGGPVWWTHLWCNAALLAESGS
jgi:hypothetical protein